MAKKDDAAQTPPQFVLVVVHPFGDYKRGDRIEDPVTVAAVLNGENAHHCHKVTP